MNMSRVKQLDDGASGRVAFAQRLQHIIQHWPSADRLARSAGVSPSALRKWLRGEAEPSRDRLIALAQAATVDLAWLATGLGDAPKFETRETESNGAGRASRAAGLIYPRRLGKRVTAGPGAAEQSAEIGPILGLDANFVRATLRLDPEVLAIEPVCGDSMEPTIRHGDWVLIDTSVAEVHDGGIYVVEFDDRRMVKRVQKRLSGGAMLISDNALYRPEELAGSTAAQMRVLGRIVWRAGRI